MDGPEPSSYKQIPVPINKFQCSLALHYSENQPISAAVEFVRLTRDEHPYRPLGKLDHSRKSQYLHAVQMQLIPNLFRGWAHTGCSSLVGLQSPRCSFKANGDFFDPSRWRYFSNIGSVPVLWLSVSATIFFQRMVPGFSLIRLKPQNRSNERR